MAKIDKCVVRNERYTREKFSDVERHNERENSCYGNGDIVLDRSHLNIHFKTCDDGYETAFDKMLAIGAISTKYLKKDPYVFDEFVFDVNTDYFDRHGGYEYAKDFFAEAYRLAVRETGGEEYVLSAVMHADERNKALSELLGRDVYHYHLHVVYIPVVDKEIYFKKNNKNPELAGKLKEVIKQVSHSKKWAAEKIMDENGEIMRSENGKAILRYSYSLLQDRFYEHMRAAGFTDFERGKRGSTAEHLSVLDYKIRQDTVRLDALDKKVTKQRGELSGLREKTAVTKHEAVAFAEIDSMAKKTIGGNIQLSQDNWKRVSGLAKEGVKSRAVIRELKHNNGSLTSKIDSLQTRFERYGGNQSVTDTVRFYQAKQRAPHRMNEAISNIMRQPPEAPRREYVREKSEVSL